MKIATKAALERDLERFIRTYGSERCILEGNAKTITEQVLRTYSNVYCYSGINKFSITGKKNLMQTWKYGVKPYIDGHCAFGAKIPATSSDPKITLKKQHIRRRIHHGKNVYETGTVW